MQPRLLAAVFAFVFAAALAAPASAQQKSAASPKQKQETCEFGANEQKLTGTARRDFLRKCMADEDSPPAKTAPKQ